ncbi:hypothetical protein [uncultured Croceitalea sp.]|uniref:hypothetical protein n=1 Tax=uncultured Croceitalea sp. TaxID=1798908 RepID=UPI003305F498
MQKILKIVLIVIGVLGAIMSFFMMPSKDDPDAINSVGITIMFLLTYLLLIVATITALFFGLKKMMTTPGGLKKTLFSIGGLVILAIIGYALAGGEQEVVDTMATRGLETTTGTVKTIGMLLNVFFGMTIIAVLLMVLPGIKKLIGK